MDVTNQICKRHLAHPTLSLPTSNLLRVVVARSSSQSNLASAADLFTTTATRALDDARARSPLPHHTLQTVAATLSTLCADTVPPAAAAALGAAMDAASGATMSSDDHEVASAFGTLAQCVIAVAALPPGAPRVPELQQKGAERAAQQWKLLYATESRHHYVATIHSVVPVGLSHAGNQMVSSGCCTESSLARWERATPNPALIPADGDWLPTAHLHAHTLPLTCRQQHPRAMPCTFKRAGDLRTHLLAAFRSVRHHIGRSCVRAVRAFALCLHGGTIYATVHRGSPSHP